VDSELILDLFRNIPVGVTLLGALVQVKQNGAASLLNTFSHGAWNIDRSRLLIQRHFAALRLTVPMRVITWLNHYVTLRALRLHIRTCLAAAIVLIRPSLLIELLHGYRTALSVDAFVLLRARGVPGQL